VTGDKDDRTRLADFDHVALKRSERFTLDGVRRTKPDFRSVLSGHFPGQDLENLGDNPLANVLIVGSSLAHTRGA
jgi:hypothetical protein